MLSLGKIQRFFDPEGVFNPITDEHFSVVAVAGRTSVQYATELL